MEGGVSEWNLYRKGRGVGCGEIPLSDGPVRIKEAHQV